MIEYSNNWLFVCEKLELLIPLDCMAIRMHLQPKTKKNLNRYAGEWVAFVNGNIVAHDKELVEVMEKVEEKRLQDKASVFLVPRKNEGPYVLAVL